MKKNIVIKVLYIFCIVLFSACSNDDKDNNTRPTTNPILIKKITETVYYSGTSDTHTTEYKYENNILKNIIYSSTGKSEFVYEGDKIVKVNYLTNGIVVGFTAFYYNGDLLSYTLSGENQDEKTEYHYTNNVLASEKSGYLDNGNYIVQEKTDYSFNETKNITQSVGTSTVFGPETISKQIYSYDNKNHPMKYMNKYYRLVFGIEGFNGKSNNNVISKESYYPITNTVPNYYNYEIVYNSDNFPTEIKKIAVSGNNLLSKTTIEYQ